MALDISSVVRFCQTTFATARTPIVNVHTPRFSGGAQVGIGAKVAGSFRPIEGQRVPYPFCILCGRYIVGTDAHIYPLAVGQLCTGQQKLDMNV